MATFPHHNSFFFGTIIFDLSSFHFIQKLFRNFSSTPTRALQTMGRSHEKMYSVGSKTTEHDRNERRSQLFWPCSYSMISLFLQLIDRSEQGTNFVTVVEQQLPPQKLSFIFLIIFFNAHFNLNYVVLDIILKSLKLIMFLLLAEDHPPLLITATATECHPQKVADLLLQTSSPTCHTGWFGYFLWISWLEA